MRVAHGCNELGQYGSKLVALEEVTKVDEVNTVSFRNQIPIFGSQLAIQLLLFSR